jgi:Fe2+ or Zn2+ uptake regulation protein
MIMDATAQTFDALERLTRIAERRTCILAVLAEARDYRARATDILSEARPDHSKAGELEAVAAALYKLASAMEVRT